MAIILAVGWALALAFGAIAYRLLVGRGRLLLQIEALETRLAETHEIPDGDEVQTSGLPVGSPAPDFALPDLNGNERPLEEWRGRPLVLVFFDPDCRFSMEMLPGLAALPAEPTTVVVTTGERERIRALAAEHDLSCTVLLQDANEVAQLFLVPGTPSAYPVDADGWISGQLALGSDAVLALAAGGRADDDSARTTRPRIRPVSESRLLRTGLEAGATAPPFTLPALDGGEISLADYRGRRVLLVFVDPNCVPCDAVAPELERLHRSGATVVAISRGDLDANRAKAAEHGLTFPVALQRHWDTSRDYGMFAVPIGYLIDEQGVLVSGAAVGADEILALTADEPEVSAAAT